VTSLKPFYYVFRSYKAFTSKILGVNVQVIFPRSTVSYKKPNAGLNPSAACSLGYIMFIQSLDVHVCCGGKPTYM